MRLVYVDEAGLSNAKEEPFLVVGAVVVNADKQLVATERRLDALVERWIPEEHREGFVFHAMEIFNGGGKVFRRDDPAWPLSRRLELADDLAALPKKGGLKLTFGSLEKANFPDDPLVETEWQRADARSRLIYMHAATFISCAMVIDMWMRTELPNEVCLIVAEDNDAARQLIRDVQRHHQSPLVTAGLDEEGRKYLPLRKVKEDPLFQPKRSSSVLQLADFWSYVLKRKLMGDDRYDRFAKPMWASLIQPVWASDQ